MKALFTLLLPDCSSSQNQRNSTQSVGSMHGEDMLRFRAGRWPCSQLWPCSGGDGRGWQWEKWRDQCLGLSSLKHLLPALHAGFLLNVLPPVTHITKVLLLQKGELCMKRWTHGVTTDPNSVLSPIHPWEPHHKCSTSHLPWKT